jgi:glutamate dehydrogenase (NADP+)
MLVVCHFRIEMSQNSLSTPSEEVDENLKNIMLNIHASCVKYGLRKLDM